MKKFFMLVCMSLVISSFAVAQTTAPSMTSPTTSTTMTSTDHVRASKLVGTNVKNNEGDTIGEIGDLIISGSDKMVQAIVSVGGFLGIGERHVSVPYDKLKISRMNDDYEVFYPATKAELEGMSQFSYDEVTNVAQTVRSSKFIGTNIKNETDETIGEVEDLIVTSAETMPQVILSVGDYLDGGEKLVAVPYDTLKMSATDDKEVIYATTKDELAAMPAFSYTP